MPKKILRSKKSGKNIQMRIIAGALKGRIIHIPSDFTGRPTRDMVREALFDILFDKVLGSRFLDLFCGSGATGIEAVSRGALKATLVDSNFVAIKIAKTLTEEFKIVNKIELIRQDVRKFISSASESGEIFDIVFCDPPYDTEPVYLAEILCSLSNCIEKNGVLIIEHRDNVSFPDEFVGLFKEKERRYGATKLSFFKSHISGDV